MSPKINGTAIIIGVIATVIAGSIVIGAGKPPMSALPIAAWLVTVFGIDLSIRLKEGTEYLLGDECGGQFLRLPVWALSVGGMLLGIALYFEWV